jgi:hypothetical protein
MVSRQTSWTAWLCSANIASVRGVKRLLAETLPRLQRISALRVARGLGLFLSEFLAELELRQLSYVMPCG